MIDIGLGGVLVTLVLWYVIFLGNKSSSGSTDVPPAFDIPDTARPRITTHSTSNTFPLIFDAAFVNGTTVQEGPLTMTFHRREIGNIKIETGKIIACDNVNQFASKPFTETFPIGNYPVELSIVKFNGYDVVAFSRILFSADSIASWEYALLPGQKPIGLTDSLTYCYPVDAATGLFIDSIASSQFTALRETEWNKAFPITNSPRPGYIYEFDSHNMAVFTTGGGDGCYSTFIGYDPEHKPCCLLTDFGMVQWWEN